MQNTIIFLSHSSCNYNSKSVVLVFSFFVRRARYDSSFQQLLIKHLLSACNHEYILAATRVARFTECLEICRNCNYEGIELVEK